MSEQFFAEPDGYTYGVSKLDGVSLDGYMAEVITPRKRSYGGRFSTIARALHWCRHIIARDRRAPLEPNR